MNRRWLLPCLLGALISYSPPRGWSQTLASRFPLQASQICTKVSSPTSQWYDREYRRLVKALTAHASTSNMDAPEQASLLERIYGLRNGVSQAADIDSFFERAALDDSLSPLARAEAEFLSIRTLLHRGQLTRIEERYEALGYLRRWRIIEEDSPPASTARPGKDFVPGPLPWISIEDAARAESPFLTLETEIRSSLEQKVVLRFSSEEPASVRLNNVQVLETKNSLPIAFDQYAVAVSLKAGVNMLRVSLLRSSAHAALKMALRTSNNLGESFIPARAPALNQGPNTPDDLLTIARNRAGLQPNAKNLEALFWLERDRQIEGAWKYLERAAELWPSAETLFQLAKHINAPGQRSELLRKALALDPQYLPALLKLAEQYSGRGENYKASLLLQGYLQGRPCESQALRLLSDLRRFQGDFSLALDGFRELAEAPDKSIELTRQLVNRFIEFGLLQQARTLASSAAPLSYDDDEGQELKIRMDEQALDSSALLQDYGQLYVLYPHDRTILRKLISLEQKSGEFGKAATQINAALMFTPEDPELLEAKSILQNHRNNSVFPANSVRPNSDLRLLLAGNSSAGVQDEDHVYLEGASELASRWKSLPIASRSNSQVLTETRVDRVSANYLRRSHVQKVIGIAIPADVPRFGVQTIRYSPDSEQLAIIHARVFKANGITVEAEDLGDTSVADAQSAMYYDVRARNIRFSRLEPGDVIELEYRISPLESQNPYGKYFAEIISFGAELDHDLQRYVLIAPAEIKIFAQETNLPARSEEGEGATRIYRWEARGLKAIVRENRSPSWSELAPYVHVSTIENWQELGNWYAKLIAPQFALNASLQRIAEQIAKQNHSDLERIQAVHEFVIRNTHYVALEFGIYSYKPYPVTQTFERKFGDCKDKASLIVALLRAMRIEADIALVRTQRMGRIAAHPASVAVFDHALAYVPKYDLWLDGTAEFSGLRELPIDDQGAMALTVASNGQGTLREIPVSAALDNYTWRSVQAQVDDDGTLHFSGVNYVRGQEAPGMRRELEKVEYRREFVRGRLAAVLPSVEIQAVSVPGASSLEEDFMLSYRGEMQPRMKTGTLSIPSSWIPRPYLASLAPDPARQQELLLQAPWTTEEEVHIRLAPGVWLASIPGDVHIENKFGAATLRYMKTGDELVVFSSVQFRKLRIGPEEYPAFREFTLLLDDAFRRELQVRMR